MADRRGRIGAVDPVYGAGEVDGPGAERVAVAAGHPAREVGLALDHFRRWCPIRPFGLAGDHLLAGPSKTIASYADAVADRLTVAKHVVEIRLRSVDDHGA